MNTLKLNPTDRDFFFKVTTATFSNPFGEERENLDKEISGFFKHAPSKEEYKEEGILKVLHKIDQMHESGTANYQFYSGEEIKLMKYAFLFDAYHRFLDPLDELINDQVRFGEDPCPVPFAEKALNLLCSRGFSKPEALMYFALFFQLRRAFYFILKGITGTSPCMKNFRCALWNNVFTGNLSFYEEFLWNRLEDFSTLLLGETGTGKGTAASAIGRSGFIPFNPKTNTFSESFTKCFISTNLSGFPESLIESELFGHRKGAFTGAIESHPGIFDRGSPHGAIFLDEIGDVSVPVQIKLLQVLQERTFSPVGAHEKKRFAGRVIAATNHSVDTLRREGKFRNDFFYRLCSDIILVPTLRQRISEDESELPELIRSLSLKILGADNREFCKTALGVINKRLGRHYSWPGNVRELEQCIRRIILTGSYEGEKDFQETDKTKLFLRDIQNSSLNAEELLAGYCGLLYNRHKTYEEVARLTGLDRRTVKKYILANQKES